MSARLLHLPALGPFRFDPEVPTLYNDGMEVKLPRMQALVLRCLFNNPHTLSRDKLQECAWGKTNVSPITVRNTVNALKSRLINLNPQFPQLIRNRGSGLGWVLDLPPDPSSGRFRERNLPPLQRLFGRSKQLSILDRVYRNKNTRLVVISGRIGGEGKSQLAHRWLRNTISGSSSDIRIFGFSFNSQGISEKQQTSSGPFLTEALSWFDVPVKPSWSDEQRAENLARAIIDSKSILYLDGLEAIQHEPVGDCASFRDRAMRQLLLQVNRPGDHFCLVSTRYGLSEFHGCRSVKNMALTGLDPLASVKLLRHFGVSGGGQDDFRVLARLAKRWGHHPLSLVLLGNFLSKYCRGDARAADTIRMLRPKGDRSAVPYRPDLMVKAHEQRLRKSNRQALRVLELMGLFDRPVDENVIGALIDTPKARSVDKRLRASWRYPDLRSAILRHLTNLGLITQDTLKPRTLFCHPLVQQCMGASFRARCPADWRLAHVRLYHYFADSVTDRKIQTASEMELLYRAVSHGCAAGRFEDAFNNVYWRRISREDACFSTDRLGLFAEDIACLASFFERPFVKLMPAVDGEPLGGQIFNIAGFRLRTLGRLAEAEFAIGEALRYFSNEGDWDRASTAANNLAVLLRMQARLGEAISRGNDALKLANRTKRVDLIARRKASLAEFHHYAGNFGEASRLFKEAENQYTSRHPEFQFLPSTVGFRYCELLMNLANTPKQELIARARTVGVSTPGRRQIIDGALSLLCQGRVLVKFESTDAGLTKAERILRRSLSLVEESHHQDNWVRIKLALSECLRLRGCLQAAKSHVREAAHFCRASGMMLHLLDCQLEEALIDSRPYAWLHPSHAKRLVSAAKESDYGLLFWKLAQKKAGS